MTPQRETLLKLGGSIVERAVQGERTKLGKAVAAFVDGITLLDGRVPPARATVPTIEKDDLARVALLVGVITRNELQHGASLPQDVAAALPTGGILTPLDARACALARVDFNAFAELISLDDETGRPILQAPIHRRWAALCDQFDRLIIWSHVEAGKTTQLSILRTLWELGNDPRLRFVILSNTSGQATRIVKSIAAYIRGNDAVKRVFPRLRPDPEGVWTTSELQVARPNQAKDPSVRAVGVRGALTGGRVDRLVIDDILDGENTDTPANRKAVEEWVRATALGRLTKAARVVIVGNAWNPEDLLHILAASDVYEARRFPILDSKGEITWPEAWSRDRIEKKRRELGPVEFSRQLLCEARDDSTSRFKQGDIDTALAKGRALTLVQAIEEIYPAGLPPGIATFTGVDLAMSKARKSDDTVFFSFAENELGERRLLNIEIGKFSAPEIVSKIVDHHRRYQSTIAVESNAAQSFILDFTRELTNVPVVSHTTTRAKKDPLLGVESLAIELANGKWTIPSRESSPNVDRWIREMLYYSPHVHTGDVLMASYFAREVARRTMGRSSVASVALRFLGTESKTTAERPWQQRIVEVPDTSSDDEADARAALRDAV